MKNLKSILLLFIFSNSVFAANELIRPKAKALDPKSYEAELSASLFNTLGYYDVGGNEQPMDEEDDFRKIDFNVNLTYAYSEKLNFLLGGRFRQVESTDANNKLTNSGAESFWGGLSYSFRPKTRWFLKMFAIYRQTSYTNEVFTASETLPDEIILGDDGTEFRYGAHISYLRKRKNFFNLTLAYVRPPNELSSEIDYDVDSTWKYTKWAFALGLRGIMSLNEDPFESEPDNQPRMATGSTSLFNSINRSYVMPYGTLYYAMKSWRWSLSVGQRVAGSSTDQGSEFILSILWNSKGINRETIKDRKFKEYIVDADVIKVSPRRKFVKIDKGLSSDVEKGMRFDIYQTDFFGGNKLVATGIAYDIGSDWSILKIVKRYRRITIKNGFSARGY